MKRRTKVLGGTALLLTAAGAIAYQHLRAKRLDGFLEEVDIQLEVMLSAYLACLHNAACDGVDASTARQILTYNPSRYIEQDGFSLQLSALPLLSEPQLDIFEVHAMGESTLLHALADFLKSHDSSIISVKAIDGADGVIVAIRLNATDETFGHLLRGYNGEIAETIRRVTEKLTV